MNVYGSPDQLPQPVVEVIEKHLLFLNHFQALEDDTQYRMADYFAYGASVTEEVVYFPHYDETLRCLQVCHDSEGGPALLIAYFTRRELRGITQYFDTTGQIIFRDGHLVF